MQALEGIKVIDLTHLPPGGLCTMILGDLGAEVIKIEAPSEIGGRGAGAGSSAKGEAATREMAYNALNRNKKSVGINLKSEGGKRVFFKLLQTADVVIEGYRPGVMKRLGIDYDAASAVNPRIIYCSLSGYGQDGPYSQYPGHDLNYLAVCGILDTIGSKEGPHNIPMNLIADFAGASLHGVIGIQAALLAREKTGRGQFVDISYLDGALELLTWFTSNYFSDNVIPKRGETALHGAYPYYGSYKALDGQFISLGCIEPWFWANLCRVLGKEEYSSCNHTMRNVFYGSDDPIWSEITGFLKQTISTKTSDEWIDLFAKNDIPATRVLSFDGAFKDPQVLHRKMVLDLEHPTLGKVKQIGIAVKLSDTPGKVRSFAPLFGENTEEVLQGLGYSTDQIKDMREGLVIA